MGMYLIISKLDAAMHLHFIDTVTVYSRNSIQVFNEKTVVDSCLECTLFVTHFKCIIYR